MKNIVIPFVLSPTLSWSLGLVSRRPGTTPYSLPLLYTTTPPLVSDVCQVVLGLPQGMPTLQALSEIVCIVLSCNTLSCSYLCLAFIRMHGKILFIIFYACFDTMYIDIVIECIALLEYFYLCASLTGLDVTHVRSVCNKLKILVIVLYMI